MFSVERSPHRTDLKTAEFSTKIEISGIGTHVSGDRCYLGHSVFDQQLDLNQCKEIRRMNSSTKARTFDTNERTEEDSSDSKKRRYRRAMNHSDDMSGV